MLDNEALAFLWVLAAMNYWMRENGYAEDKLFWADKILFENGYALDFYSKSLVRRRGEEGSQRIEKRQGVNL